MRGEESEGHTGEQIAQIELHDKQLLLSQL